MDCDVQADDCVWMENVLEYCSSLGIESKCRLWTKIVIVKHDVHLSNFFDSFGTSESMPDLELLGRSTRWRKDWRDMIFEICHVQSESIREVVELESFDSHGTADLRDGDAILCDILVWLFGAFHLRHLPLGEVEHDLLWFVVQDDLVDLEEYQRSQYDGD